MRGDVSFAESQNGVSGWVLILRSVNGGAFSFQAKRLKKEQEALVSQHWELERLEEDRRRLEESRRKTELGYDAVVDEGEWG